MSDIFNIAGSISLEAYTELSNALSTYDPMDDASIQYQSHSNDFSLVNKKGEFFVLEFVDVNDDSKFITCNLTNKTSDDVVAHFSKVLDRHKDSIGQGWILHYCENTIEPEVVDEILEFFDVEGISPNIVIRESTEEQPFYFELRATYQERHDGKIESLRQLNAPDILVEAQEAAMNVMHQYVFVGGDSSCFDDCHVECFPVKSKSYNVQRCSIIMSNDAIIDIKLLIQQRLLTTLNEMESM